MNNMNLTVRPRNGGWQYIISYKDKDDKWRQTSKQGYKTKALAKSAGQERMKELDVPVKSDITFSQVARLVEKDGMRATNTIKLYKSLAKVYDALKETSINTITYEMVAEIVFAYQKKHKFGSTKKVLGHGKMIMSYAIKKLKVIKSNPFDDIVLSAPKMSDKAPKRALTMSELDTLVNSIPIEMKAITAIMAYCGLRIGEARGLTRADIVDGEITLHHQRLENGERGPLKTTRSYRTVPMSKKMQAIYAGVPMPISKDAYIFPCFKSGELITAYAKTAYKVTPHELRHSFTTNCIAIGIDFKTTAQLIGDTVELVYSTYSHVNVDMLNKAKLLLEDS